ncbi:NOV [Symbiodinium sp. CCMP2456]|nr:NOV [Symbiodinium sp. CCMP2456]
MVRLASASRHRHEYLLLFHLRALLNLPSLVRVVVCEATGLQEFGFEGEKILGSELQVKQNARLARALKRLAGELYGSDVHWQLELLQNADDNSYQNGTVPTAEFLLRASGGGEVIFRCNETGFREAQCSGQEMSRCSVFTLQVGVAKYGPGGRAIPSVVATGEKGLGFKAVFALTDRPRLFSGPYRLEFDSQHPSGIGYVLPRWLEDAEEARELCRPAWGSVLRMPLRPELQPRKEELFRRLASLPPSLLLFLKRLREVSVELQGMSSASEEGPRHESFAGADCSALRVRYAEDATVEARWEEMTGPVKLEVSRDGGRSWEADHWLLLRRRFQVLWGLSKPGLASPPSTLLELALPKSPEGGFDRSRGAQQVFAFLPVRTYGLPFALQADWAVSSSREELLAGCAWNEFLKAQVPQLMLELVAAVQAEPVESALRWTYYAAIPATAASTSTFFRPVVAQVLAKLRGCDCMLTDEETFCQPQQAMRCSDEARAAFHGCSPLPAALRAQGFHLLHEKVEASAPAGLLDSLGVQRLGAAALLRLLPKTQAFPGLDSWRQILVLLDQLLDAAPRNDAPRLVEVARQLPLLPLKGDGSLQPAASKLVLPPAKPEVEGFPPELLAELRAVDPRLFAEGGADTADTDEGTLDALAAARIRKLLRRLGVVPLTPRLVVKDIIGPLFSTCAVVPCVVSVDEAPRPPSALLALGGFLAQNAALAEELGPSAIGWPLKALDKVALGRRFSAPALHSPRAAAFLEAAKGVLDIHLPAAPAKLGTTTALGEALETLGLALPGPLVTAADGDFRSPEFEQLTVAIIKEARETGSLERARLLAQALNVAWQSSYLRYARRGDGVVSGFLLALQSSPWLPPDDPADGHEAPEAGGLCCPAELVAGTAAVRAALPDAALLKGRLCSAVSGAFAEALGVVTEPSVELVMKVLRGFVTHSPVGPDSATAIYGYLEREGADLAELRRMPSVVVAAGEAARVPADVVWEDANCDLPALQQLYSVRWRRFFVIGLGVPERPTAEQVLRRLDQLSASNEPSAALWPLLLRVAKELSDPSSADAEAWAALPAALAARRCVPLQLGGLGAPKEGVLLEDAEALGVPEAALAMLRAQAPLAAPAPKAKDAEHWPVLAEALKLQSLSTVCSITSIHGGEERPAPVIAKAVASLLPLAQRFLIHKHRAVYDAVNATCLATKVEKLIVREVDPPLKLRCVFSVVPGQDPIQAEVESDCYLEVRSGRVEAATSYEVRLRMLPGATLPALCVELARLLLPPAKPAKQDEARLRQTREALATFLASAALAGASGASSLCEALQIPALPSEDSADYTSPWPMPKEVAEQLELERRLLEAAQETEPERLLPPKDEEAPAEPPSKRARTEGPEAVVAEAAMLEGAAKDRLAEMDLGEEHETGSAARDEADAGADPASGTALEEVSETDMKDAEALLKNISVIDQQIGENGEGKGPGKGKGKSSGKGGDKPGKGDKERGAAELGRILDRLPGVSNAPEDESSEAKKEKAFRTRVYDLEDLRAQSKKMRLGPLPNRNDLPQEEREKVGRWGEQFVYEYLQKKLEHEDSQKRVIWVNEVEETGFQYDLRIEDSSSGDVEAYVEVKTSRAKDKQLFEMSYREWTFAQKEGSKFVIFRVSNAGKEDVELCSITNPFRQWKELNLGLCLTF